eukprot:Opistho-1_new@4480
MVPTCVGHDNLQKACASFRVLSRCCVHVCARERKIERPFCVRVYQKVAMKCGVSSIQATRQLCADIIPVSHARAPSIPCHAQVIVLERVVEYIDAISEENAALRRENLALRGNCTDLHRKLESLEQHYRSGSVFVCQACHGFHRFGAKRCFYVSVGH